MNINLDTLIMRQFINTLAITLVFLTSFATLATENFEVEVKSDQILNIKISNLQPSDQLIFKDSNGEVLFKEQSLSQPYTRHISLEDLPNGTYSLSLEDTYMTSTKTIFKTKSGIRVSNSEVAFKPHFQLMEPNSKKVKVAFVNSTMQPAQFKVLNKKGQVIFNLENSDTVFSKTLDFSEVPSGNYSIAVNTKGRSYYKDITIK